jgi:hypothetical protein
MMVLRLRSRDVARRLQVIDTYAFPAGVRSRFALRYQSLSAEEVRTVEAATRQWFRLVARHPKARLAMPSVVVDELWHELVLHTRDYAEFCVTAFVRFLHHTPESAMTAEGAAANRGSGLAVTYRLAREDEHAELPLLFRVDGELGVEGGRRYLADCGGRGLCHELPGVVCLQHVTGPGRGLSVRWDQDRAHRNFPIDGGGAGCAGG